MLLVQAVMMLAAWGVVVCAFIDAALPQPRPGSHWVPIRKVVSALGVNVAFARNAIAPGSTAATITALDLLEASRANAGKLADIQQRVTAVMVATAQPPVGTGP